MVPAHACHACHVPLVVRARRRCRCLAVPSAVRAAAGFGPPGTHAPAAGAPRPHVERPAHTAYMSTSSCWDGGGCERRRLRCRAASSAVKVTIAASLLLLFSLTGTTTRRRQKARAASPATPARATTAPLSELFEWLRNTSIDTRHAGFDIEEAQRVLRTVHFQGGALYRQLPCLLRPVSVKRIEEHCGWVGKSKRQESGCDTPTDCLG